MRLLFKLTAKDCDKISVNYNYALSSSIYSFLKFVYPEFSEFLHKVGYKSDNKVYKLFTFTLKLGSTRIEGGNLQLKSHQKHIYIYISLRQGLMVL